jgi:two-component system, sensor histidine kinase and response regulator
MESVLLHPPDRAARVLVVDDAPDNIFLVQAILQVEGYEIVTASSGRAALASVFTQAPDLILLDILMSDLNGYEVTRQIRQNSQLPYVPILLITAAAEPQVADGLDAGADDFIRKPVDYEELVARVRSLLRLKHSVDALDQVAQQREEVVSRLTHDLRTPLVAMQRMLTLLQTEVFGTLAPELVLAMGTLYRNNHNLLGMVNNLLEVYRYESAKKVLQPVPIELGVLLEQVVAELHPLAVQKQLELQLDLGQHPVRLWADPLELRRVFQNLIDNAIKFTEAGWVRVEVVVDQLAPDWAQVRVQDSGVGVEVAAQARLFERFPQVVFAQFANQVSVSGADPKNAKPEKTGLGGTGLGLYLSKKIVELHGGQLVFVPVTPGGSCCVVTLPLSADTVPAP